MVMLIEMDEKVNLSTQTEANVALVILIYKFNVNTEEVDQFLRAWAAGAAIMKRQPGYISAQLHRGAADSCVFINYAVWKCTAKYKRAVNNPEFQSCLEKLPASTLASLHLLRKVAVPGSVSNENNDNTIEMSCSFVDGNYHKSSREEIV